MDFKSEFKQMEILVSAVTTLTNNQFELLATIRTCGERINILVERADIHMNIIENLQLKILALEERDSTGHALSLARKARQRDDN